jgi:hypothetical protein
VRRSFALRLAPCVVLLLVAAQFARAPLRGGARLVAGARASGSGSSDAPPAATARRTRSAFVTFVMGDAHARMALALFQSLRDYNTSHELLALVARRGEPSGEVQACEEARRAAGGGGGGGGSSVGGVPRKSFRYTLRLSVSLDDVVIPAGTDLLSFAPPQKLITAAMKRILPLLNKDSWRAMGKEDRDKAWDAGIHALKNDIWKAHAMAIESAERVAAVAAGAGAGAGVGSDASALAGGGPLHLEHDASHTGSFSAGRGPRRGRRVLI